MNNIAISPHIFMYALQNQNVEHKIAKQIDIKKLNQQKEEREEREERKTTNISELASIKEDKPTNISELDSISNIDSNIIINEANKIVSAI